MITTPHIWFEVNTASRVAVYLSHATQWARVGPLIVTSRHPDSPEVLRQIAAEHSVIGGFKLSHVISDPNDADQWRRAIDATNESAKITGSSVVVIEAEGSIMPLTRDDAEPAYDAIRNALRAVKWPEGIEVWWWPGIHGESAVAQARSTALAQIVIECVPGTRLINASIAGSPASQKYGWSKRARMLSDAICPDAVPMAYLGDNYWSADRAGEAVAQMGGGILYPHWSNLGKAEAVGLSLWQSSRGAA